MSPGGLVKRPIRFGIIPIFEKGDVVMNTSHCKGCMIRYPGCHSECELYKQDCERMAEIKRIRDKKEAFRKLHNDYSAEHKTVNAPIKFLRAAKEKHTGIQPFDV